MTTSCSWLPPWNPSPQEPSVDWGFQHRHRGLCGYHVRDHRPPLRKGWMHLPEKKIPTGPCTQTPEPPAPTEVHTRGSGSPAPKNFINHSNHPSLLPRKGKGTGSGNRLGEVEEAHIRSCGAAGCSATSLLSSKCPLSPSHASLPPTHHPQLWERVLDRQNLHRTSMDICHEFRIFFTFRNCN